MRIGIVAPACPLDAAVPDQVVAEASAHFGADAPELVFHPQCFLTHGHFAGTDKARADALLEFANDSAFDAIWFARGGYGSNRIATAVLPRMNAAARNKAYFGYSDMGFLLAGLYARRIGYPVHGPMPSDMRREGGGAAIRRALDWLVKPVRVSGAPQVAFNMTVLSHLIGTLLEPDLTGHVLLLEDVDEYHYQLDRLAWHITSHSDFATLRGIKLGRVAPVPENDRPFDADEEIIFRDCCLRSEIPYLGRADIGHDVHNAVVPFG